MTPVPCARWDEELAALLAGEAAEATGDRLRGHAAACPRCAATAALIDWAQAAPGERDGFAVPDAAYWSGFDARLRARLAREKGASARRGVFGFAVAAAVLAGLALLLGALADRVPGPEPEDRAVVDDLDPDPWAEFAEGAADAPSVPAEVFPEFDRLDDPARRRLLEWLSAEEKRLHGGDA